MRRIAPLILALLAACGNGSAGAPRGSGTAPCRATSVISVGERIPAECRFERSDGTTMALSELAGTPAVLNFWASWCVNCVEEMPALERAHVQLGGRVRFVGVDLLGVQAETKAAALEFVRKTKVTYDIIFDPGGLLYGHFSARLFPPTTIWVDAAGVVRHRQFGPLDTKDVVASVKRYLGVG